MDLATGNRRGVDAHKDTHHAAVLTSTGELLGDKQFHASSAGYRQLRNWAADFGEVAVFAVESTGSYGGGLARFLIDQGCDVREVTPPRPRQGSPGQDRCARCRGGSTENACW